jgi:hypothetical protein
MAYGPDSPLGAESPTIIDDLSQALSWAFVVLIDRPSFDLSSVENALIQMAWAIRTMGTVLLAFSCEEGDYLWFFMGFLGVNEEEGDGLW